MPLPFLRTPFLSLALSLACVMTGGCLAPGADSDQADAIPAVIAEDTSIVRAELKSALASAVGRAQVELGPDDFTMVDHVSVLPPQLGSMEDHSTARPTIFAIILQDGVCYAVHPETSQKFRLSGIDCHPLAE